jgi:hypothetical protein
MINDRQQEIAAATLEFEARMAALDVKCAGVIYDPTLETATKLSLYGFGNLKTDEACAHLFATYVEMTVGRKDHEIVEIISISDGDGMGVV